MAEEFKIEPSFLATRSALTAVVLHRPNTLEKIMETSGMMRWQAELLAPAIKNIL